MKFEEHCSDLLPGDDVEPPASEIIVSRLFGYIGMPDPWGCEPRFDPGLVQEIDVEEHGGSTPNDWYRFQNRDPCYHAARIRYLIDNPHEMEPIEIDNECTGGVINPIPVILDGWHRYYAHVLGELRTIQATYGGRLDLLEYLEGETDIEPEF